MCAEQVPKLWALFRATGAPDLEASHLERRWGCRSLIGSIIPCSLTMHEHKHFKAMPCLIEVGKAPDTTTADGAGAVLLSFSGRA